MEEEEVGRMTGRYCRMSITLNSHLAATQQEEDTAQQPKAKFGGNAFAALDQDDDAEEEHDVQCNKQERNERDEVWI